MEKEVTKHGISACIVAYNEEKVIERCLKSLQGVVNETILVHDGECQDKTLEIAQRYGARIFIREHNGEAEKHRPFTYKEAQYEWVLQIDADEFLSDKARKEIPKLVERKDIDAYAFRWPLYDFNTNKYIKGPFDLQLKTVLLRKEKMYQIAITHEAPKTFGNFEKRLDITLEHKPCYDNLTFQKMKSKWLKWGKIQAEEIINIDNAEVYNYKEEVIAPILSYYRSFVKHPYLTVIKRYIIFDLAKKILKKGLIGSPFKNYKIIFLTYINVLYLAYKVNQLKQLNSKT